MLRRTLPALLTLFTSVLLALLASEAIARWLLDPPRYHREPVALDPDVGFIGIPDLTYSVYTEGGVHDVVLNRDGLRGRALPEGPAALGVQRVAFLGDSFLVADAVRREDLVTSRVEAALLARGRAVEVYNLAAVDWGTGQQLLYLDRVAETLAPDIVVLAFYQANDVVNNAIGLANETKTSPGDTLRPYVGVDADELRVNYVDPRAAWMRRHSRLYAVLEKRLRSFEPQGTRLGNRRERVKAGFLPLEELELFRAHAPTHRWEQAWQDTFALLEALQRRCTELGARLVVLVIPSVHQVKQTAESVRVGAEVRAFARRPLSRVLDWNEPDRRLASFFRSAGIEAAMLLDPLRELAGRSPGVYARDWHLGAAGHALLSASVLDALEAELPEPSSAVGEPVPWPAERGESAILDFAREPHAERLGDGWIRWSPDEGQRPWGWWIGASAMLALEPDRGPLLLRGWLEARTPLPLDVSVQLVGAGSKKLQVRSTGRFELRFDFASSPPRSESGHVAVVIQSGAPVLFHVEAIGFESHFDP